MSANAPVSLIVVRPNRCLDQMITVKRVKVCVHVCVCCMYVEQEGAWEVGGGAHGCFLWENGRSGVRGQCLGRHSGDDVRSDPGQVLLDKFLYSCHLLRTRAVGEPWVGFVGHHLRVDYRFEFFCSHGTELHGDNDVHLAVAL